MPYYIFSTVALFIHILINVINNKTVIASGMSRFKRETDNSFRTVFSRADKIMYSRKEYLKEHNN